MKRLLFFAALWISKLSVVLLKFFRRKASFLPGEIALKISKDFLRQLKLPKTVIAVTGTNGKTTVSNLIASVLRENGYIVTNNSFGSNVIAGIAAALLTNSTLTGRVKGDVAALEVDERSSITIFNYLAPDYLVCVNIMRDSVERNAHPDFIRYIIDKSLSASTKLILNADDIICSGLGGEKAEVVYFGVKAEKPTFSKPSLIYCPRCSGKLEYEYIRYDHIGVCRCDNCGYRSPEPDFAVSAIDRENNTFTVAHNGEENTYHMINDNIVNIYNFCCVVALLTKFGLSYSQIEKGLSASEIVKIRYDRETRNGITVTLQAGKGRNPVAVSRGFDYVRKSEEKHKCVLVNIDDKFDNVRNSENICWIFDADYSPLADDSIDKIIFAGPRSLDHRLQALLSGASEEKILVCPDVKAGAEMIDTERFKNIFIVFEVYRSDESRAAAELLFKAEKRIKV